MGDQFIKAYCERTKQYFGLRVENVDGRLRVTDFYDIETATARLLASTVDVENLQSAFNLRACFVCGSRGVGGCGCAKEKYGVCEEGQGYLFQCLYCSQLRVALQSEGAEDTDGRKPGDVVILTQGQEVEISAVGAGALEHIRVAVGWDKAKAGANMDVDSSVYVMSSSSNLYELIFFAKKEHPSGCVMHMGDNLVGGQGEGLSSNDSENIHVYLQKVPEDRDSLYFVLNIYNCKKRHQTFGDVQNMFIRLYDEEAKRLLTEYNVVHNMASMTGMVIAKAYRKGDKWMFQAIGQGYDVEDVQGLHKYCR